jgi:hypothetical protein
MNVVKQELTKEANIYTKKFIKKMKMKEAKNSWQKKQALKRISLSKKKRKTNEDKTSLTKESSIKKEIAKKLRLKKKSASTWKNSSKKRKINETKND